MLVPSIAAVFLALITFSYQKTISSFTKIGLHNSKVKIFATQFPWDPIKKQVEEKMEHSVEATKSQLNHVIEKNTLQSNNYLMVP